MSFDISTSLKRAQARLDQPRARKPRRDRGVSRLPAEVATHLDQLLAGLERPRMREVLADLQRFCEARGLPAPWRSTVYDYLVLAPVPTLAVATLPKAVRAALYNFPEEAQVPAHQVAFHCFNYGSGAAVGFAAALPWLVLHQAARLRGYRPKSRGLLEAVLRARRLA